MGQVGRNQYEYLRYPSQAITEGAPWQPPGSDVITLRDEAGVVISSANLATMVMTVYNIRTDTVIPGADAVDIKNARSCTISPQGVLVLKLLSTDTVIIDPTQPYEIRRILVRFSWPTVPTKADALEITVVIRNLHRLP